MGWLGPRGWLRSCSRLLPLNPSLKSARPYDVLFAIAGWTIFLSVLLHGFSALPLAAWYSNRLKTASPDLPELLDVPDLEPPRGQIAD